MSATLELDAQYMRRAIRLAMNGRGRVEPNPMVGCVIVKDERVIGEGYHQEYGGPHAEPNALANCTESPEGAAAYVTLEPCCHLNKQTPPCVPNLIAAKLERVVVGCIDPNPEVNGKGLASLREAGIVADEPVLEAEAKQLIAPFIARTRHGRPYVTLKWAQTADGKVAGAGGATLQISDPTSMRKMHELRARCDAILVGIRTVKMDDPVLTARGISNARRLTRVILDSELEMPFQSRLMTTARDHPLLIYCHSGVQGMHDRFTAIQDAGAEIVQVESDDTGRLLLAAVLSDLGRRGITHLMVEAGPRLAQSFMAENMADRVWVFESAQIMGDSAALNAVPVRYPAVGTVDLDGDVLTEYLNPRSPVFFANERSADLVLADR